MNAFARDWYSIKKTRKDRGGARYTNGGDGDGCGLDHRGDAHDHVSRYQTPNSPSFGDDYYWTNNQRLGNGMEYSFCG